MDDNKINLTKETNNEDQNEIKQEVHVEAVIPEEVHPVEDPVPSPVPTEPAEDPSAKKNKKIGIIAIVAVAAAVIIGGGAIASANAYKEPIKDYFEAMEQGKGKKLQKAYGKAIVSAMDDAFKDEDMYDDGPYDDIDEVFDEMAEGYKDQLEDQYGKKTKVTYKITDKEKLDKDDLKDYKDTFKDSFDKKLKVTKGYEVDVKVTCKGKDDKGTEKTKLYVLKVNGKWMTMGESDLMLFSLSGLS